FAKGVTVAVRLDGVLTLRSRLRGVERWRLGLGDGKHFRHAVYVRRAHFERLLHAAETGFVEQRGVAVYREAAPRVGRASGEHTKRYHRALVQNDWSLLHPTESEPLARACVGHAPPT
ncbi:MAG: hypothetical protein AAF411_31955, partial [Myxococcota bacterium]